MTCAGIIGVQRSAGREMPGSTVSSAAVFWLTVTIAIIDYVRTLLTLRK
jgi:enamine deaminase RidA (YjgF/YER057c/UK114 family)